MGLFDKKNETEDEVDPIANEIESDAKEETLGAGKEKTPGQIKGEKFRKAMEDVIKFAVDNKAPTEVIDACKILRPSYFGIAGGGGFAKSEFTADQRRLAEVLGYGKDGFDKVQVGDTFDEMKAFMAIKAGRREMHVMHINLIKFPGQKDRVWVEFNATTGVYTVAAIGAEAPEGWKGYTPKAEDAE